MSFGADIGAILRSGIAPLQKLMVIAVRYHHPDGAPACRLVEISGMGRSTAFRTLDQLRDAGWVDGRDGRWTYAGEPIPNNSRSGTLPVPERDSPVPERDSPVPERDSPVPERDSPVPERDSPPSPPNKVLETFSRPSPDEAPAPTRDGLVEVIDAFRAAQPGVRDQGGILRGAGLFLSPAATAQLAVLVTDHGAPRVIEAITEAVASDSKGGVTIRFVASIAERMANGTPKPGARRGVAYRNSDPTRECGPKSTEPNEW